MSNLIIGNMPHNNEKFDFVVFIGRMQPIHTAHIQIINEAFNIGERVIILFGSANHPRTIKDPWSIEERMAMLRIEYRNDLIKNKNLITRGIEDYLYNNEAWIVKVQNIVDSIIQEYPSIVNPKIAIIGHEKDESSYYLKMFPQWKTFKVKNIGSINSTTIRESIFSDKKVENLTAGIENYISGFLLSSEAEYIKSEFEFIKKYKKIWEVAPYAPIFCTSDAVVIQHGHVLMIKRRSAPGKGLWALPGGFLDQNETFLDGMIRELREETKIKVPEPILRGSIVEEKIFDAPNRSLRGRTVTMAFKIILNDQSLPKVKGSDDAEKAKWIPLNEIYKSRSKIFEDHLDIINYFTR